MATTAAVKSHFRNVDPKSVRLKDLDPADTLGYSEAEATKLCDEKLQELAELQQKLMAAKKWALLVILQGIDTAGKDSAAKHVLSGLNAEGVVVAQFGYPTDEDLKHDFLWRANKLLPARGQIVAFNRSYYEDVLAVRINPDALKAQNLPPELVGKNLWTERFEDINNFEQHLYRSGTKVMKFYFHLSEEEQAARIKMRLSVPEANWKFSPQDLKSAAQWKQFQSAAEDMLHNTNEAAPWHILPADNKWVAHLAIATQLVDALKAMDIEYPLISDEKRKSFKAILSAKMRLASKAQDRVFNE